MVYFQDRILYHIVCEIALDESATVPERIRFYRTKRNMTGETLAELIGVSRTVITCYEKGYTNPTAKDLERIAAALGVEMDKLYDDYYKFLVYPYAERMKQIRAENGFSKGELAIMLGVAMSSINNWEGGRHAVSREIWERLKSLNLL